MSELHPVCPLDRQPLPSLPASTPDDVVAAVARARAAQPGWAALPFDERAQRIRAAAKEMLVRREEAVELIRREAGKFRSDILMSEALGPLEYAKGWIRVARAYVAPRRLPIARLAFPGKRAVTETVPRGVAGVIAPWNYPLANFFKPVFPALLVGNAVVVKPSEHAPRAGAWFASVLAKHLPTDVIQVVQGAGDVGDAMIEAGVDCLTFTGSVATGKKVIARAAEKMIPCSVELGGKDPAIVLEDCELDRTVLGVLNWGVRNAGQDCGAIERVYVVDAIADDFIARLAAAAKQLRASTDDRAVDVAPLANERQLQIVEAHVADAVEKGARVLAGGRATGEGFGYEATILDRCTHAMKVVSDETFGPVLAIVRVKDADEAIAKANDSRYGLNASIWTKDLGRADALARRLEVGTIFINNHAITGAMPFAPWTGVKSSGHGVANSSFALGHYTRPRTILVDSNKKPDFFWLPSDETLIDIAERLADAQLGRLGRALALPGLMRRRVRTLLEFVRPKRDALPAPSTESQRALPKANP